MTDLQQPDLLRQLEQKVAHAVEVIDLLRMQIEELEDENSSLKAEHEKWRNDLVKLIKRFDHIDGVPASTVNHSAVKTSRVSADEEEFMTV